MKKTIPSLRERLRKIVRPLAFGVILSLAPILASQYAWADDPGNNDDSIVIRITPRIDYGVVIDTTTMELDYTLDMGATAYAITPATVTIVGNIRPVELDIEAANISASPVWSLDTDESAGLDELQLYGLFAVGRSTRPLESEFSGAKNLITITPTRAGQKSGNGADQNFENNIMQGGADMDWLMPTDERQLWFRMDTPPVTSTTQEQTIQVTVTATRTDM